jgi:hypothetical protein
MPQDATITSLIQFPGGPLGGDHFCKVLERLSITHTCENDDTNAQIASTQNGNRVADIRFASVKVWFLTAERDRITHAVK